nr:12288_t:CDS:2 [Entrophospora candida]
MPVIKCNTININTYCNHPTIHDHDSSGNITNNHLSPSLQNCKRKFNEEPPSPYNLYYSSSTITTYTPTTRTLISAKDVYITQRNKGHKPNECPNILPK